MKRILGMGYASATRIDMGDSFLDRQWNEPLTLRFNQKEHRVFIRVNKANQEIKSDIQGPYGIAEGDRNRCEGCVEVEAVLPLLTNQPVGYHRELFHKIYDYYKRYKIAKSRIDFQFEGLDGGGDNL